MRASGLIPHTPSLWGHCWDGQNHLAPVSCTTTHAGPSTKSGQVALGPLLSLGQLTGPVVVAPSTPLMVYPQVSSLYWPIRSPALGAPACPPRSGLIPYLVWSAGGGGGGGGKGVSKVSAVVCGRWWW